MGRRKLKIQRLETMKARQATYSKRKTGIVKKAKEISILCDVDVALLMFSPTDKPTLFVGQEKLLSDVLERLSKLPLEEREERRAYTMQILKKIYANTESDFDLNSSPQDASDDNPLKLYEEQLRELKGRLAEKSKILRDWKDPRNVEDIAQLKLMEEHLAATLNGVRNKKSQFAMEMQRRERGLEGNEDQQ
ncbi:AGAMOUS-like 30 [Hibiscus trionum]|uniref:AGAMOUS-like 30 n=1 Tax=Hibiscus trionum TaxID=183268 RepID=A0A9W7IMQ4_HIBTR|nr:AGAMOUS-like 30 [Hibiscus trionum]